MQEMHSSDVDSCDGQVLRLQSDDFGEALANSEISIDESMFENFGSVRANCSKTSNYSTAQTTDCCY